MADPVQLLRFVSWVRDGLTTLIDAPAGGRAAASTSITLTARNAGGTVVDSGTRQLSFLVAGPADVTGLTSRAIVRRYPAPGTVDHESDRCPYIELAEDALPWRYTPTATPAATSSALHPWFVLIVGEEGSELSITNDHVTIEASIQDGEQVLGAPETPHRFAHVQIDAVGHRTARVLCGRKLRAATDYLAVVVPAYDATGAVNWTGSGPVTVAVYDSWRFRTASPAGSFEDLAARLQPGLAPAATGRAAMTYSRLDEPDLEVIGALVASRPDQAPSDGPLPDEIRDDLAALQLPALDERGRPIVALPRYGEAWNLAAPAESEWGRELNGDPRRRGVAGLGLEVGIRYQDELVADVLAHLGALQEARQRVRNAVMGVAVARSLWRRRVPTDATERLWMLGPALGRLTTGTGTVAARATAGDRTAAAGTFSAAARRMLRSGPPRTAGTTSATRPGDVLTAVNRQPPAPPSTSDGLPVDRGDLARFDQARRRTIDRGRVDPDHLLAAAADVIAGTDARLRPNATRLVTAMSRAASQGRAVPWGAALTAIAAADTEVVGGTRRPTDAVRRLESVFTTINDRFGDHADDADLIDLLAALQPLAPNDPVLRELDVTALADGVTAAFDPTTRRPPIIDRVLETIGGIDDSDPMAPPEPCVGLNRAAWNDVAQAFDEWLLPQVGDLDDNVVVPLRTNPVFVDAFLTGLNTQLLTELRWRNIPIATGCTPIRRFWDRADTASGERVDDIAGLQSWLDDSPLGAPENRPGGATGTDLVIAVRGALFLRYPTTLVYLTSARHGNASTADFDQDPSDGTLRILPGFQGRIRDDVAFFGFPGFDPDDIATHWLVFEEPPAGYRFANDLGTTASTGDAWAEQAMAQPVRVLIRGDALVTGGGS